MSQATTERPPVPRRNIAVLAVGDAAVFALFTAIGIRSHAVGFTLYHFGRDFIPLTLAWFLVAMVVDTYGVGGRVRVGLNWLVGVTAGIIVRKWWVGDPNGSQFWTFLAVALVTNGAFLLVWRFLASKFLNRSRPAAGVPAGTAGGPGSVAGGAGEGEALQP
jgi:hypothetical protein